MTYHFNYRFDRDSLSEPEEWQVYLTPGEERDCREEGTDPASEAARIAAEEIIELEAAVREETGEEPSDPAFLRQTLVLEPAWTEPDDEEEPEDTEEDEGWSEKLTRTETVNRITHEEGLLTLIKTTRVTRIVRKVKTDEPEEGPAGGLLM